jgi:Lon protease-like protein
MAVASGSLPAIIPVFAVPGALLLPGARLPLTVFEPRYLAMTDDALGAGRLYGLVQPRQDGKGRAAGLYDVGCLARITAFGETGDGRYLITSLGLSRFTILGEEDGRSGYRRVRVDYGAFAADLAGENVVVDRKRLFDTVGAYLKRQGVALDPAKLEQADDADLVTALAMTAPLSPEEKQALLEATTATERAQLMIAMFEMALLAEDGGHSPVH